MRMIFRALFTQSSRLLLVGFLAMQLSGCILPSTGVLDRNRPSLYRPPTLQPPATVTPQPSPTSEKPTLVAACTNLLSFIRDVTIPDGTQVKVGSTMDKRWEVENSGTCNWNEHYRLRLVAGPDLGAATEQNLFPARSGARTEIRIVFTAPNEPGAYRSAWQAFTPDGQPFGDFFYIDIIVESQ